MLIDRLWEWMECRETDRFMPWRIDIWGWPVRFKLRGRYKRLVLQLPFTGLGYTVWFGPEGASRG